MDESNEIGSDLAFNEGFQAKTICDNPYWIEFQKPSKRGHEDELNARKFVDGYVSKIGANND